MSLPRLARCPCRSGARFADCCAGAASDPNPGPRALLRLRPELPLDDGARHCTTRIRREIDALMRRGNLAQADILLRYCVELQPDDAAALNSLGWIAAAVGLLPDALGLFTRATQHAGPWPLPARNLQLVRAELERRRNVPAALPGARDRFLLIRAWGCGFWSDVSHVLGQLLVAELTGRVPIVHWGPNSLFGDGSGANAFPVYFEPVSAVAIEDVLRVPDYTYWPPKWNRENCVGADVNRFEGWFARMAGIYLLGRTEDVVVSDFYTPVFDLAPWIPAGHPLHGMPVDRLWRYLAGRYLRPRPEIVAAADAFHREVLGGATFVAVHARGSDKVIELANLDAVNEAYATAIAEARRIHGCERVFVMTDDATILARYVAAYGAELAYTDSQRTSTAEGVHYTPGADGRRLGREMMLDTYIALRATAFVGNAASNPSVMISYLRDWAPAALRLIGDNFYLRPNTQLHSA